MKRPVVKRICDSAVWFAAAAIFALSVAAQPPSVIVQVAVNYGPQRNAFLSGVVTGDARMILTDSSVLKGAREITIAYSDSEVADAILEQIQQQNRIALLPIAAVHGQPATLSPLAREASPGAEISAVAGGAPKPFAVERRAVRLRPEGSGAEFHWVVTPALPAFFRGGPLLDAQGKLIAILVQESGVLVGMPLQDMIPAVDISNPAPRLPIAPNPPKVPAAPALSAPAKSTPVPDIAKPAADAETAALFKETAIRPAQLRIAPATLPARSTDLDRPLAARKMSWAARTPPSLSASLPPSLPPPAKTRAPAVVAEKRPAAEESNAALKPAPLDAQGAIRAASELLDKHDYAKAVETLEDAVHRMPDENALYFHLGLAYWYKAAMKPDGKLRDNMDKTSYHKAVKTFEAFLQKAPNDPLAGDARARLTALRSVQYR